MATKKKKTETQADPEATQEMQAVDLPPQAEAFVSPEGLFTINVTPAGVVEISPRPWEGPAGLVTRKERIGDLIEALKKL